MLHNHLFTVVGIEFINSDDPVIDDFRPLNDVISICYRISVYTLGSTRSKWPASSRVSMFNSKLPPLFMIDKSTLMKSVLCRCTDHMSERNCKYDAEKCDHKSATFHLTSWSDSGNLDSKQWCLSGSRRTEAERAAREGPR